MAKKVKKTSEASLEPETPTVAADSSPLPVSGTTKPYAVVKDGQGVAYLRVSEVRFILNTGSTVELIEMDPATIRSRNMEVVDLSEEKVIEAARILLTPLTKSVMVSERAKKQLEIVLNDKEFIEMANEKKAEKAKKSAKKAAGTTAAPKKAAKAGKRAANLEATIVKKFDGEVPYREGSARQELLKLAVKSGTVGKFYAAAGKPKGGTPSAYLGVFVRDGHVALK